VSTSCYPSSYLRASRHDYCVSLDYCQQTTSNWLNELLDPCESLVISLYQQLQPWEQQLSLAAGSIQLRAPWQQSLFLVQSPPIDQRLRWTIRPLLLCPSTASTMLQLTHKATPLYLTSTFPSVLAVLARPSTPTRLQSLPGPSMSAPRSRCSIPQTLSHVSTPARITSTKWRRQL
jgi:hypothetical protein